MLISDPAQITPEWLTERLTSRGILHRGAVTQVRIAERSSQKGTFANTASLEVTYAEDAIGVVPSRLFLKASKPDLHPETLASGEREVAFYKAIAGLTDVLPIPHCYDSAYDAASGRSHILIDDLSTTHYQTVYPLIPSPRHCELIVRSLAQLHAYWWNSSRLYRELGPLCEYLTARAVQLRLEATLPRFLEFLGDSLLPWQRHLYRQILDSTLLSRREERLQRMAAVTLTHGDAHAWSFMLPRDAEAGQVMVIDWQLWEFSVPTDDLAYHTAFWWSPARRAALERPLVVNDHGVFPVQ